MAAESDNQGTLILCNAPYYLPHALTLYERQRSAGAVRLMAVGIPGIHDFLQACKLPDAAVGFVPLPQTRLRLWNPLSLLSLRLEINRLYGQLFAGVAGATVYTFGGFNDVWQAAVSARLSRQNRVINLGIFDGNPPQPLTRLTLKQQLFWRANEWVAQVRLLPMQMSAAYSYLLFLDDPHYGIVKERIQPDVTVQDRYAYRLPPAPAGKKTVLLLESADGFFYRDYEKVLRKVMELFMREGFHVWVKGHPRCGYSTFLNEYPIAVLPAYVPAEFLAVDAVDFIFGIHSLGLGSLCKKRQNRGVASLLDLFQPVKPVEQEFSRKLLQEDKTFPVSTMLSSLDELRAFLRGVL
jgi:hypothetical protein